MTDPVLAHAPAFSDLLNDGVSNLVVLDFDGVINPFASRFDINQKRFYRPNHLVHVKSPWNGNEQYPVKWSDDLMSDLSGIMGDPGTVLIWLTAWKQHVAKPVNLMGLETHHPQYWLDFDKGVSYRPKQGAKRDAMRDYLGGGTLPAGVRVAWADDEVLTGAHSADVTSMFGPGLLPVRSDPMNGLSKWDVTQISKHLGRATSKGEDSL